jgi:hypothetical protein
MSRYEIKMTNGNKFVYGYDRPLQYFFVQVFEPDCKGDPIDDNLIVNRNGSKDVILNALKEFDVEIPDEHLTSICYDLDPAVRLGSEMETWSVEVCTNYFPYL